MAQRLKVFPALVLQANGGAATSNKKRNGNVAAGGSKRPEAMTSTERKAKLKKMKEQVRS